MSSVLLDGECQHLMPRFLCRTCSAEFFSKPWAPVISPTGRRRHMSDPEMQTLRPAPNYMAQSQNAELFNADFAEIERRVIARYRPKNL